MFRNLYTAAYRALNGFDPIPDDEIDAEVRRIMVEYGTGEGAVAYAEGAVERLQWSKNMREQVKAERVLEAVGRVEF